VIDIARDHKNEEQTILFNLSGHGLLDLLGYQKYISNELD
jgi:tryptophan synthase beta chain